ncbi:MAG: AMP nucleosidase [Alphaproteobacteria bacterium]
MLPLFTSVMREGVVCETPAEALERIQEIYLENTQKIRQAFLGFQDKSVTPALSLDEATYPYLGIAIPPSQLNIDARVAYGAALEPGIYGTTLTRPDLFADYYLEQLALLMEHHRCPVVVGKSMWPIPLPFVDEETVSAFSPDSLWEFQETFALPDLSKVDDTIVNGTAALGGLKPLAPFTAERVDYSLHRLPHYCGTSSEHFQRFILLTNYQRYVEAFVEFGKQQLLDKTSGYTELVTPGDKMTCLDQAGHLLTTGTSPQHLPQMPAYHLKRSDRNGITFINIGVGPTNAKTITDHLAVLRPHCWIMVGHCGGFRRSQKLGDYVLAHAYVRDDHVLEEDVPLWVPIPPIAEVQVALQEAVASITGLEGLELKTRMRTGTVVSSDNRNWELRSNELFKYYNQSRAIALDLESATIATNGFRFRVPYGTLLCVSDKPLHGELKLKGMATQFYRQRVEQHLRIGLETIRILREKGVEVLHSRKLRGFDEPPFR